MHVHILGICGTFMGSMAILAKRMGYRVSGCDANVYPPMSTLLAAEGIDVQEGYDPAMLEPKPDIVVIGNAMSRGNPQVEACLDGSLNYVSGPEWLAHNVLRTRHVLAVSGTHGKTTTASMLAWILQDNGLEPGFLIGGVPANFNVSAALGGGEYFVIEADEYDSAFFDKRSKFIHYRPNTLLINNIEFDHADIFDNLAAIQKQFHHLLRTVPSSGTVIAPAADENIAATLAMGCWSASVQTDQVDGWHMRLINLDGSCFEVLYKGELIGVVNWTQLGHHNTVNALQSIAAATCVGIDAGAAIDSLCRFKGVKRRMELRGKVRGVAVYDDFAHHPTAIETTLAGLRAKLGNNNKLIAVLEPRSNTMKMGVHDQTLAQSVALADEVFWFLPESSHLAQQLPSTHHVYTQLDALVAAVAAMAEPNSHILVMSNGGFGGIHQLLLGAIEASAS